MPFLFQHTQLSLDQIASCDSDIGQLESEFNFRLPAEHRFLSLSNLFGNRVYSYYRLQIPYPI